MAGNEERPDDDPKTDAELLEKVKDVQDEQAWRELVRRYRTVVRRYCRGEATREGEELAQGVWLKLVRELPTFDYDPSRSFRGLLRTMSRNAAVDHFRRLGRAPAVERLGDREPIAPREFTTTLRGGRRLSPQEAASLQEAVRKQVRPDAWEIFRRCAIEGERISDVARELGRNYAAVYMACERVRFKVRKEADRRLGGAA
ncbi:RNA polymerase sigma factor [Paludisphaera rhizosphaerae]|uniref:RNA polymerase sigma factor n=1 Tax=Paludisphaera rhizosphaerae TaxID=2711216 RepID=UPI0013E9F6C3|nr:sigma-70 family RNA polymerase sigma factor [Paludisphaera rhizosphaerae]